MSGTARDGSNGAGGFAELLETALRRAAADGVRLSAGSSDLESAHFAPEAAEGQETRKNALDPFEADPVQERHPGEPQGESGLSYFLDGVQSTREVCRVGTVPVVTVTVAAAIVRREDRRLHRFPVEGVPEVVRAVVLPGRTEDPQAQAIFEAASEALPLMDDASDVSGDGAGLVDSTRYDPEVDPADYAGLKTRAYVRARALRESLEAELLRRWGQMELGDGWIAVDGQLPLDEPRGLGLVKSSSRPFLRGDETRMLLDLTPGCRTTAFVPPWRAERADAGHTEEERASWYVRMWPPGSTGEGADATSGLVRVEAASDAGWSPEEYDEISRWILAERAPLARPDPRWPSMIHPVHYVEKVLKPLVNGGRRSQARIDRLLSELAS